MYEARHQQVLSRVNFAKRIAWHLSYALVLLVFSLGIGMMGYAAFEDLSWLDAFLNAAMLLGGMGPIHTPLTAGGKLFAGLYALYAGLVFVLTTALVLTPIVHRVLHQFHWDEKI